MIADASLAGSLDRVRHSPERIAAAFGIVTSTFRTVAHNREVGGVHNSYHLLGRALDVVRRAGVSHAQIASALRNAGFVLIESLDEGNHSHFAFGPAVTGRAAAPQGGAAGPHLLGDEHGTLLSDLALQPWLGEAPGAPLRIHIRTRR